ncbi:MAG: protein-glutamate O-methyltransferase CheR [Gemmatimonadetes bacterium]|nr:protein-glutamate O-methyltransferase CheR [Gemmatimonadota bacterium]NIO31772.1 protein-glutamate O-methyltransferase CheR [Gemmatimonadota bacterium]
MPATGDDTAYAALFAKIERERGFRGNLYRQKCLRRRVGVRMRARGLTSIDDYSALLDKDPAEYDWLLRVLTINVSKFFRNRETWDVIANELLPGLLVRGEPVLMWSAGSAAGEEAYSLAILVWERLGSCEKGELNGVRIIGTDIDQASIDLARSAEYPEVALSETPEEIRRRWFVPGPLNRLKDPIRSMVEFRNVDILKSRPGFKADLILCRNLLIYLDRPAQGRVFEIFVDVLRSGGYLVLGRVETLAREVKEYFDVVDARERIYQRR